jgi:hypothetical protein
LIFKNGGQNKTVPRNHPFSETVDIATVLKNLIFNGGAFKPIMLENRYIFSDGLLNRIIPEN